MSRRKLCWLLSCSQCHITHEAIKKKINPCEEGYCFIFPSPSYFRIEVSQICEHGDLQLETQSHWTVTAAFSSQLISWLWCWLVQCVPCLYQPERKINRSFANFTQNSSKVQTDITSKLHVVTVVVDRREGISTRQKEFPPRPPL